MNLEQKEIKVQTENLRQVIPSLRIGYRVLLSGSVYTVRDAAHKKIFELLEKNLPLPFDLKDSVIYYASPTPAPQNNPQIAVGACGPTTSSRMDGFTPALLDLGLTGMIGKGNRSPDVIDAIVKSGSIYLCAIGGAGALISKHIKSSKEIAFSELGCESIKLMKIEDMPLVVAIDSYGNNIFSEGKKQFAKTITSFL